MNPRLKKLLRIAVRVIAWLVLLFHLVLLYFGIASPLTTISIYGFVIWLSLKLLKRIADKKEPSQLSQNIRLAVLSTLITLLAGELTLRFVFRTELSYQEENGNWFYISPYRIVLLENIMRKHYLGEEDVTLRIRPPHSQHRYAKSEFSFVHHYNNEGVRDVDFKLDKGENEYRVLTLGDSYTEGVGAPADSTWPKMLERPLQGKLPKKNIHTMNLGASGSDLIFEYDKLQKIGLKYRPDLVILALNASDRDDLMIRGGRERFQSDQTLRYYPAPADEYLYAFSYIFRQTLSFNTQHNSWMISARQHIDRSLKMRAAISQELESFQTLADEHGFAFCVVFHPLPREINNKGLDLNRYYEGFIPHPPHHKVNILDYWQRSGALQSDSDRIDPPKNWYWKKDRHHTATGYKALADAIVASLPDAWFLGDSVGEEINP